MGFRFGTWPHFNGKKVVLEDDERLSARVPTLVPLATAWRVAADFQAVGAVPIRVDGTLVLDGTLVML
jgi:hypothetical protein